MLFNFNEGWNGGGAVTRVWLNALSVSVAFMSDPRVCCGSKILDS